MNARQNNRRNARLRWIIGSLLAALVLALAAWLAPNRIQTIDSLEGPQRWSLARAPLRRTIIWEPAEKIEAPFANLEARASLIRPQLDENGTVLYFTLRKADNTSDIYRARLVDGKWQPAQPVAELNSNGDDVGPVISRDGKTLYLYSDRSGGQGGFDLYAAERRDERWSTPRNLGPRVNSPAHEFDPAISPDGARLFFASNRSPQMHERSHRGSGDAEKPWRTTLRADLGLAKFDLYQASRDEDGNEWSAASRLDNISRPDSNEGAPYVSASGSFLYFNSDRPARRTEATNFDLYRARIRDGKVDLAENLGTGINTEANELEPALSSEGYRLFFSRSRGPMEESGDTLQYDLFASRAAEVEEGTAWDNSRVTALVGNLWWLSMLALLVALLASFVWFARRVSFRRLSVSGFLLAAIFIHLLMGTGTFFVYFGNEIVQQVKRDLGEAIVATDINLLDSSRPEGERQPDYEKAADLTAPETVKTSEPPRQIVESPNVPVPTRTDIPQVTSTARSETPVLSRPLPTVPDVTPQPTAPALSRRNLTKPIEAEPVELAATQAARPAQSDDAPRPAEVTVTPKATMQPSVAPREMPAKTIVATAPSADTPPLLKVQVPSPTAPQAAPPTATLVRASAARPTLADAPPLAAEPVAPVGAPSPETAVERAEVMLARKDVTPLATVPVGAPKRVIESRAAPGPTLLDGSPRMDVKSVAPATPSATLPLKRASLRPDDQTPVDAVALVTPEPSTAPKPADMPATGNAVDVTLAKATTGTAVSAPQAMPALAGGNAVSQPSASALPATPSSVAPTPTPARSDTPLPRELVRRGPATKEIAATGNIALEGVAGEEKPPSPMADQVAATDVNIARRDTAPLVGPTPSQPTIGGPHRSESMPLALGSLERQSVPTPLSASPVESRLARLPSRSFAQKYAEDAIRLQGLLRLRQADGDTKRDLLSRAGADERTLATIHSGLNWMQQHQHADGHWSLDGFHTECGKHGGKPCTGLGTVKSDMAATGFALLPFLGDGHTHRNGKHQATVAKGVKWLVDHQRKDADPKIDGELYTDNPVSTARMYSHGIATIALCEAYALSRDEALKDPAQRAIRFIVNSQNKESGGWRYQPGIDADTSVVGWQVMALKSGQMAELDVPQETLDLTRKFLQSVAGQGPIFGQFGYQPNVRFTPAMTAEALLCLEYLGVQRTDPALQAGTQHLLANLPQRGKETSYYWYYGTQCMYHMQGETWRKWSAVLHPTLIDSQIRTGEMAGSWLPEDSREAPGGAIMSTSLRVLMLEVNYRHLPLYQVLDQAASK